MSLSTVTFEKQSNFKLNRPQPIDRRSKRVLNARKPLSEFKNDSLKQKIVISSRNDPNSGHTIKGQNRTNQYNRNINNKNTINKMKKAIVFSSSDDSGEIESIGTTYCLRCVGSDGYSSDEDTTNENSDEIKEMPPHDVPKKLHPTPPKQKSPFFKRKIISPDQLSKTTSSQDSDGNQAIEKVISEGINDVSRDNPQNSSHNEENLHQESKESSRSEPDLTDEKSMLAKNSQIQLEIGIPKLKAAEDESIVVQCAQKEQTKNIDINADLKKDSEAKNLLKEKEALPKRGEFESGVTDLEEISILNTFLVRIHGSEIPKDLIPYKMITSTKMSFLGEKMNFKLLRGGQPILYAKLRHKSGTKFIEITKLPEKKSKNIIASLLTGVNFSTFSLRRGNQFGKELMNIKFELPQNDCSSRNTKLYFFEPPEGIPNTLTSRKPKSSYGSSWAIDMGGRIVLKSIKNCILVDENNKEIMSVMKNKKSEIIIETHYSVGELCVFALGISSVSCRL